MKKLNTLNLENNLISNINALKNLSHISSLNISYNLISNIEVILKLDELNNIFIVDNLLEHKYKYFYQLSFLTNNELYKLKSMLNNDRRKKIIGDLVES